ncbi:Protein of unknown function [Gryllus bimaculatus]|nr:Protein of unknown function [Gryllus bimaculatus]
MRVCREARASALRVPGARAHVGAAGFLGRWRRCAGRQRCTTSDGCRRKQTRKPTTRAVNTIGALNAQLSTPPSPALSPWPSTSPSSGRSPAAREPAWRWRIRGCRLYGSSVAAAAEAAAGSLQRGFPHLVNSPEDYTSKEGQLQMVRMVEDYMTNEAIGNYPSEHVL